MRWGLRDAGHITTCVKDFRIKYRLGKKPAKMFEFVLVFETERERIK